MFLLQNILENAIPIKAVIMFENSLIRNQCLAHPLMTAMVAMVVVEYTELQDSEQC